MPHQTFTTALAIKVRAIQEGRAENALTPFEFVQHLLDIHQEDGQYAPIARGDLDKKLNARLHYTTEMFHEYRAGDILPWRFAVGLANLTSTNPYYWLKGSYTLNEATEIRLDMKKQFRMPNSYSPMTKRDARASKIVRIMFEESQETLTPLEFVDYLLDTHKVNGFYQPIPHHEIQHSINCTRPSHFGNHFTPNQAAFLANVSNKNDTLFWRKESFTLADAEAIILDTTKIREQRRPAAHRADTSNAAAAR